MMISSLRDAGKVLLQRFYSPRHFLWRLSSVEVGRVALTFDDGPDPTFTPQVLDLLAEQGIKATFFLIGEKVAQHPELVRRMAAEGHGIGGHTWTHREIVGVPRETLLEDMGRCRQAMFEASGVDSVLFRPPRGRVDLPSIHRVCRAGYCLVHWSRTYSDYKCDGVEPLLSRFRSAPPKAGDIVLLHDHNADTVAALARMIPEWHRQGLVFPSLST
ncbi:MAG: polysaccharide deacetylase family protein [Rhodocyclaceae bacterium]|nr:MAG: polysaccharide deacetylase family protein [Rhodocyclaceae bacterium]